MKDKKYIPLQDLVSTWVIITSWIFIILSIIMEYSGEQPTAIGLIVLMFLVEFACGKKCAKLAMRINKSANVAYFFGFLFSLAGLLVYWIYFKIKLSKIQKYK